MWTPTATSSLSKTLLKDAGRPNEEAKEEDEDVVEDISRLLPKGGGGAGGVRRRLEGLPFPCVSGLTVNTTFESRTKLVNATTTTICCVVPKGGCVVSCCCKFFGIGKGDAVPGGRKL